MWGQVPNITIGYRQRGVAELCLDNVQRPPFVGQLEGVRVVKSMGVDSFRDAQGRPLVDPPLHDGQSPFVQANHSGLVSLTSKNTDGSPLHVQVRGPELQSLVQPKSPSVHEVLG